MGIFSIETEQTIQLVLQWSACICSVVCIVLWIRDRKILPFAFGITFLGVLFIYLSVMGVRRVTAWARFNGSESPLIDVLDLATLPLIISVFVFIFSIMAIFAVNYFIDLVRDNNEIARMNVALNAELDDLRKRTSGR